MYGRSEVLSAVIKAIAKVSCFQDAEEDQSLYFDLEFDSVDILQIIIEIEEIFDVSLNDNEILDCKLVKDVVDNIHEFLESK